MKVNWKVIESDDVGTRVLAEKRGWNTPPHLGDTFEEIKQRFEADMRKVFVPFTETATREYCIEPVNETVH